jgi:molybdopterin/thiamine biosynthesis adenylyltransferase
VASAEFHTVDPASLDGFRAELIEAGFEPSGEGARCWVGPICPPLASLTAAETMRLCFRSGWPYRPPTLYVDGIESEHAVLDGELCLFQPGETAVADWLTYSAYSARIGRWVDERRAGFRLEDDLLDPHLYLRHKSPALATLELGSLPIGSGGAATGALSGRWVDDRRLLGLSTAPPGASDISGRWYYNPDVAAPPRDLAGFREVLSGGQRNNFARRLKQVQAGQAEAVFALLWETRAGRRNCLIVLAEPGQEEPRLSSLELAPTDAEALLLRAGPDAAALSGKHVVVFGAGAIGSHVASLLARCGLGDLRLIESETLRPGNLVRHAGAHGWIGWNKAKATEIGVRDAAPWTKFSHEDESPWDPDRIAELISDSDLAVDATGLNTFAELISRVALGAEVSLVSAALFRGGFMGRVRRQVPGEDTPFIDRGDPGRWPVVPAGEEPLSFEHGCSAAVNNASPIAVAAVSATLAEVAVDLLTDRLRYAEELIDVYRPLAEAPFDRIGRVCG